MSRCKNGNPKKRSRFICLKCGRMDGIVEGIQRVHAQREKYHIKDLYCTHCGETVKALEVRYNDYLPEMQAMADELTDVYYGEVS